MPLTTFRGTLKGSSSAPTFATVLVAHVAASIRVLNAHPAVVADHDGQSTLMNRPMVGIAAHHQLLEVVRVRVDPGVGVVVEAGARRPSLCA